MNAAANDAGIRHLHVLPASRCLVAKNTLTLDRCKDNVELQNLTTVTTYSRLAASARVRVFEWLDATGLNAESHTYLDTATNDPATLLRNLPRTLNAERKLRALPRQLTQKHLLLARQASPLSNGRIEGKLLRAAEYGVYDVDDALYASQNSARERLWSKKAVWNVATSAADMVIVGNETLANRLEHTARNIRIIPSCVRVDAYTKKVHQDTEQLKLVWLGTPATEKYLLALTEPLLALHKRHQVRLTLISAGQAPLGELDRMVDRVPWTLESFANTLTKADVGIMPLRDDDWSRGKCAYKLLQYGASGLPLVGSPVGANQQVLSRAKGFAPRTSAEWYEAIESLVLGGVSLRAELGQAAFDAVRAGYSFEAWKDVWLATVRGVHSLQPPCGTDEKTNPKQP